MIFHCLTVHAGGGHTLEAGRAGCFHSYRAGDSKPAVSPLPNLRRPGCCMRALSAQASS